MLLKKEGKVKTIHAIRTNMQKLIIVTLAALFVPLTSMVPAHADPYASKYDLAANSDPQGFTEGPDGAMWFTEFYGNKIGRITTSGSITEYSVSGGGEPYSITTGPDGALWFTEFNNKIGRITTSGSITQYSVPFSSRGQSPEGIAAGSDGNLWFTEYGGDLGGVVGKITTSGTITQYNAPTVGHPTFITAGPDGNLWFGEQTSSSGGGNLIGRVTTSGSFTTYSVPTSNAAPYGITTGSDGALWFTELFANKIGRITTSGSITEYTVPTAASYPVFITSGSDGALWFTNEQSQNTDRITTSGTITEYPVATAGYQSNGIAALGDTIWYGEENQNNNPDHIVQLHLHSVAGNVGNYTVNDGTNFSEHSSPVTSGVSTQAANSDGSVTVSVNSAPGYADSGFTTWTGKLSDLPSFTATSTGDEFGLNLWFDTSNNNTFFAWDGSGNLTSLDGDTYGLSSGSSGSSLTIDGSSSFFMMDDGHSYTVAQLINGDDTASGIDGNTIVTVWLGVDVGSGSASATINSIGALE